LRADVRDFHLLAPIISLLAVEPGEETVQQIRKLAHFCLSKSQQAAAQFTTTIQLNVNIRPLGSHSSSTFAEAHHARNGPYA
jgi:hypothetical protein